MKFGGKRARIRLKAVAAIWALGLAITAACTASAQQTAPSVPETGQPVPAQLDPAHPYQLPLEKLKQAAALGRIRPALHFGWEAWEFIVLLLLLTSGGANRLARWTARRTNKSWLQAAIFAAAIVMLLFDVAELPVAAVGHAFSLHYGISIQAWPGWLLDQAKALALALVTETPLLMLVYGLMHWRWSQRYYWLWFAAALAPLMVLGAFLLPQVIEPLFNKFEPLAQSHPALVKDLERVVTRTGIDIPPERMFLMKASEKSNSLNAYVSGLGASKRIVVWDTTADRMPVDEILFTFSHETGHYVLNHIPKGLTLAIAGVFVLFWAAARLAAWLVGWQAGSCGGRWSIPSVVTLPGLVVLLLALSVLQAITEPVSNFVSRYIEHEADVYGQEAIHGLVSDPRQTAVRTFNQLGESSLDDPDPNPFIVFWTYDHPSIQSRAIFSEHYDPWSNGQIPRFFQR